MKIQQKMLCIALALSILVSASGCAVIRPKAAEQQNEPTTGTENSTAAESEETETAETADAETVSTFGPILEENMTFKEKDLYSDYSDAVEIDLSAPTAQNGVSVSEDGITITADGTYVLTGTLADGQILIHAGDNDDVRLVLENAEIACSTTAPIYAKNADKVIISLPENTESSITDSVTGMDGEEELTGAIYAECDLSINGSGRLQITANAKDAVSTSDDLRITGGVLEIIAADDGLVANDGILIQDGEITIQAVGDGIKATKAEEGKGYVYVSGGTVTIEADCDAVQAETSLLITDGTLNLTTGGGSANAPEKTGDDRFGGWQTTEQAEESVSQKGIKASGYVTITGGTMTIDTVDDSIHSNDVMEITGGTITVQSGDDGLHAENQLTVEDSTITVSRSYEGIEASVIEINGGRIDITASDDGFNAAGSTDSSSAQFQNPMAGDASKYLIINGGTITVDASGDGLDSNGVLTINGGTVYVSGPTNSANGTFDSGTEFVVNGGVLLGVGSAGMMETPGSDSEQYSLTASCSGSAGSTIEIQDASGNTLASYTSPKAFSVIVFSAPEVAVGETYTVILDGTTLGTIECTGTSSGSMGGGMMGGFGGMGGGRGQRGGMTMPGTQDSGTADAASSQAPQIPDRGTPQAPGSMQENPQDTAGFDSTRTL